MMELAINIYLLYPSGRRGKVVASHAEGCKIESRLWLSCRDLYYVRSARGTAHEGGGATTVSDAIARSCLWSTATRSSPLGYFSRLLQVVDN